MMSASHRSENPIGATTLTRRRFAPLDVGDLSRNKAGEVKKDPGFFGVAALGAE